MNKGIFISFEGPDGVGKTTQLKLLADTLIQQGYDVLCTREPGGTKIGDKIRRILLDPDNREMAARTEAMLYMADRAQHVAERILPAMNEGKIVLTDRFSDSTIVYQGAARGLSYDDLKRLDTFSTQGLTPDVTILLDADAPSIEARLSKRRVLDRLEQETDTFHKKVRRGFLTLAAQETKRIHLIDARASVESISEQIVQLVYGCIRRAGSAD